LAPGPGAGYQGTYLRGDATWQNIWAGRTDANNGTNTSLAITPDSLDNKSVVGGSWSGSTSWGAGINTAASYATNNWQTLRHSSFSGGTVTVGSGDGGKWVITANVQGAVAGGYDLLCSILYNGNPISESWSYSQSQTGRSSTSIIYQLNPGDTVALRAGHNYGGGGQTLFYHLSLVRLGL
jgi:hypothetical protein